MESRAAVVDGPVGGTDADPARMETVEVAEPSGEEVLVEIRAASLCHTDVASALGEIAETFPYVMGHEGAGVVRAVGEDVTTVEPGDHVVLGRIACGSCRYCQTGRSNLCRVRYATGGGTLRTGEVRFSRDGEPVHHYHGVSSFTQYTVVTEEVAIPVTDDLPLETASLLGCGVFTGAGAVMNTADVEAGSSVVVFGLGGVGLSGVQAADLRGATTIVGVDVDPGKFDRARNLGATDVVDPNEDDVVDAVERITDGGADYVFDMVGDHRIVERAVEMLVPGGVHVVVGSISGTGTVELEWGRVMRDELRIVGSFNGSYNLGAAIPALADLVTAGKLSLDELITATRPLSDVNEAIRALETESHVRQVLVPPEA